MDTPSFVKPKRIESTLVRVTFKAALVCGGLIVACDVYLFVTNAG